MWIMCTVRPPPPLPPDCPRPPGIMWEFSAIEVALCTAIGYTGGCWTLLTTFTRTQTPTDISTFRPRSDNLQTTWTALGQQYRGIMPHTHTYTHKRLPGEAKGRREQMWRTVGYPVRSRTRQRSRSGIIKTNICSSGYFLIPVLNLDLVTAKRTQPTCGSRPFPIGSDLFLPLPLSLSISLSITDMIINSKQTLCRHQAKQETESTRLY